MIATIAEIAVGILHNRDYELSRETSRENLRKIVRALWDYNDNHGHLPPSVVFDKKGQALYSWRVLILPYLGKNDLYQQFHLDDAWDSPHNKSLLSQIPEVYAPPRQITTREPYSTFYQVFDGYPAPFDRTGVEAFFRDYGKPPIEDENVSVVNLSHHRIPVSFVNGTGNTILVVEAGESVPWTRPQDLPFAWELPLPALGGLFRGDFHAAMADGSVQLVERQKVSDKQLKRAIRLRDPNIDLDPVLDVGGLIP